MYDSLLAILNGVSSLSSLVLWCHHLGQLLGDIGDPRIAAAVSALTTLRKLAISGRDEVDFVTAIPPLLKNLTIEYIVPAGSNAWSTASLTTSLAHVAPSLECLKIDEADIQLDGSPESFFPLTLFHALRSISLASMSDIPNLSTLLELFPNLNGTLRLFLDRTIDEDDHEKRMVLVEIHRRHGEVQERRRWKRLERVITDVGMLFALNLRSQIGMMMVLSCSPLTSTYLVASLRHNLPVRLHLQINLSRGVQEFSQIIPWEAGATLTHLTLCICYDDTDGLPTVSSMLWDSFWVCVHFSSAGLSCKGPSDAVPTVQ